MGRRHERSEARKRAIEVLYTCEMNRIAPTELLRDEQYILGAEALPEYAKMLVRGVEEHGEEIDAKLASISENWALPRMPIIDRSILRLATFEIFYMDAVPISVSINEAVELAKEFGGEDESPRFVNGVLGRIALLMREETAQKENEESPLGEGRSEEC